MKRSLTIVGTAAVAAGAVLTQAAPTPDTPMHARGLGAAAFEDQLVARTKDFAGIEGSVKDATNLGDLMKTSTLDGSGTMEALEHFLASLHSGTYSSRLTMSTPHNGKNSFDRSVSSGHGDSSSLHNSAGNTNVHHDVAPKAQFMDQKAYEEPMNNFDRQVNDVLASMKSFQVSIDLRNTQLDIRRLEQEYRSTTNLGIWTSLALKIEKLRKKEKALAMEERRLNQDRGANEEHK